MNDLNEMISKITDFLKSEVKTDTLIGQPFQLGEFTCVPVISVGMGFGAGGGEGGDKSDKKGPAEGHGTGGGAGMGISAAGFLVTRGSEIQFISAQHAKGIGAAFEKIPDLIEKYLEQKKAQEPVKT